MSKEVIRLIWTLLEERVEATRVVYLFRWIIFYGALCWSSKWRTMKRDLSKKIYKKISASVCLNESKQPSLVIQRVSKLDLNALKLYQTRTAGLMDVLRLRRPDSAESSSSRWHGKSSNETKIFANYLYLWIMIRSAYIFCKIIVTIYKTCHRTCLMRFLCPKKQFSSGNMRF